MKRHDTVFTIIFTILLAAYVHVSWKIEKMKDTFNKVHVNIKTEIIAPHLLNTEITFTKVDQFCPDEVITKKQILRKEIDLAVNEVKEKKLAKIAAKLKAKQEKEAKIAKAKLEKYLKRLAKIEARLKAKREREEKIALAKKLKEEARLAKIAAKLKEKQEKEEKRLAEIELKKQQVYLASLTKEEQKRYKQKIALEVENKKFKWAGTSCKSEIKSLDDWSNYFRVNYEQSSIIPSSALKHHKRIITLAVIDTGFDFGNPILREAVDAKYLKNLSQLDFSGANGKGYDDHGHGTHVAGIILGIMPQARILPLKYYNPRASGQENLDATLAALKFAIDQNVDIINYSGGGPESDVEELRILKLAEKKGIMVLAAAGNDGLNLDASRRSFYPAAYGLSNVVVVGNQYENTNRPSRGSNYGKIVDFFARGNSVLSFFPECVDNARMSGTSQATPVVAAIMATYKAQYPDASWLEIYNHIAKASKPMEDSRLSKHGSINPSLVFSSPFKYVERTTASK